MYKKCVPTAMQTARHKAKRPYTTDGAPCPIKHRMHL